MSILTRGFVLFGIFAAAALVPGTVRAAGSNEVAERLTLAGTVVQEIMNAPDQGIPGDLLGNAHCAVVVPGLKKGAFVVGAKYGKGFVTCRRPGSGWSAPAAVRMEGGGVGFQIGGSETDLVLLVMNDRGAQRLMSSQFTLGAEGELTAGPVGRNATAQTDGKFTAEILSWSRSRGVFGGIALQGATLREGSGRQRGSVRTEVVGRTGGAFDNSASRRGCPAVAGVECALAHGETMTRCGHACSGGIARGHARLPGR